MEHWAIEVKAGETFKVTVEEFHLLHLHQAALGEVESGKVENVPVWLHVDDKKLVVGTLSSERIPQMMLDLVFEKDFELSHGWKNGSVYFFGHIEDDGPEVDFDMEEGESLARKKALLKSLKDMGSSESSEDEDSDEEDEDSDEDDDSEDESEDEEDEPVKRPAEPAAKPFKKRAETAAKPVKRPAEPAAAKTQLPAKKQKTGTPQKTDDKKDVHAATPHPSSKLKAKKAKKGGK